MVVVVVVVVVAVVVVVVVVVVILRLCFFWVLFCALLVGSIGSVLTSRWHHFAMISKPFWRLLRSHVIIAVLTLLSSNWWKVLGRFFWDKGWHFAILFLDLVILMIVDSVAFLSWRIYYLKRWSLSTLMSYIFLLRLKLTILCKKASGWALAPLLPLAVWTHMVLLWNCMCSYVIPLL